MNELNLGLFLEKKGGESGILDELIQRQRARRATSIDRGYRFLNRIFSIDDGYQSVLSRSPDFSEVMEQPTEIFTSALILDLLQNHSGLSPRIGRRIVDFLAENQHDGKFCYYTDPSLMPLDVDDTGLALSVLIKAGAIDPAIAQSATSQVLANRDERGILHVYLPPRGAREGAHRIDPIPCANALYLSYLLNRENEARPTETFLMHFLQSGQLEQPANLYYYLSPDTVLFWAARLLEFARFRARFAHIVEAALRRRIGKTDDCLDLALRLITGSYLGIETGERALLEQAQQPDGSWPIRPLFKLGRSAVYVGATALVTAFAVRALQSAPSSQSSTTK